MIRKYVFFILLSISITTQLAFAQELQRINVPATITTRRAQGSFSLINNRTTGLGPYIFARRNNGATLLFLSVPAGLVVTLDGEALDPRANALQIENARIAWRVAQVQIEGQTFERILTVAVERVN